jgi:hypothetical protein
MPKMLCVPQAKYLKNYQIEVVFSDSLRGIIDLEKVIEKDHRPIFQELKDLKKFSQIRLDLDTITWQNGLDLSPEFLHELLNQQTKK